MKKLSKTVCMTVTHPRLGQAHQPLLTDTCLEIVGTHPAYLYGMQGTTNLVSHRHEVSSQKNMVEINQFAEMTFRIPGDLAAPLRSASGPTLPVFDFKKATQQQRDDFIDLKLAVLHKKVDADLIDRALGDTKSRDEVLRRLVLAFPEHLPEVMAATKLKVLILPMRSRIGFVRAIAMIARAHVQTYVTEICTDTDGRDFAYRLEDEHGVARHLELPPKFKKTVTHATTKDCRQPRTARVTMTIVTDLTYPTSRDAAFDIIGVDRWCEQAIGSDTYWLMSYADHRYAPNPKSSVEGEGDDVLGSIFSTRTRISLVCEEQTWPNCSRDENLMTLQFFHPDNESPANLRAFNILVREEIELHGDLEPRIAAMAFSDPRYELDELAMSHFIHVLGALERTNIDVVVLPKRWPDGTVTMMTTVRAHRLQSYVESIDSVGTSKPVKYVMRYSSDAMDPIWIETPGTLHERPARPRMRVSREEELDFDLDDEDRIVWG